MTSQGEVLEQKDHFYIPGVLVRAHFSGYRCYSVQNRLHPIFVLPKTLLFSVLHVSLKWPNLKRQIFKKILLKVVGGIFLRHDPTGAQLLSDLI